MDVLDFIVIINEYVSAARLQLDRFRFAKVSRVKRKIQLQILDLFWV